MLILSFVDIKIRQNYKIGTEERWTNMTKIKKIIDNIQEINQLHSFSIIGDPGCEGLGTYMMQVYARALTKAADDDITLIVGDLVPEGKTRYYNKICSLTNSIAQNDVYVLRGNHDTGDYKQFFGLYNYALIGTYFTIVVIDNALRSFSEEGLSLLKEILEREDCQNIIIAFHIPIPNHFTKNAVSEEEYRKLQSIYQKHKEKLKYFICGHVHSYFEDIVDDIPLICTGGGGAFIEDISEQIKASDVNHHIVTFKWENGRLTHQFVELCEFIYNREAIHPILQNQLLDSVKGELLAHLKYLTFAEKAQRRGYEKIANLFFALAESEYRHAKNFFSIVEQPDAFDKTIETFIPTEKFEYQKMYPMLSEYAKEQELTLSEQAYQDASHAEKIHAKLLKQAQEIDAFNQNHFFVCPICGYLMESDKKEERCPVCGAPAREFKEFYTEC